MPLCVHYGGPRGAFAWGNSTRPNPSSRTSRRRVERWLDAVRAAKAHIKRARRGVDPGNRQAEPTDEQRCVRGAFPTHGPAVDDWVLPGIFVLRTADESFIAHAVRRPTSSSVCGSWGDCVGSRIRRRSVYRSHARESCDRPRKTRGRVRSLFSFRQRRRERPRKCWRPDFLAEEQRAPQWFTHTPSFLPRS